MKIFKKQAFTLVELIVVITILAVLGTISFLSFQNYTVSARDSVRIYDLKNIKSAIEYTRIEQGKYVTPDNGIDITYSGSIVVWNQGTFGKQARRKTKKRLDKVPVDPLTQDEYTFSVTANKGEFELGAIMEGDDIAYTTPTILNQTYAATNYRAYITGTYNGKIAKAYSGSTLYIFALPSIISANPTNPDIEYQITNKQLVMKGYKNLPSSYNNNDNGVIPAEVDFVNANNLVVFSGSTDTLKNNGGSQITLISNLQQAYNGTAIENNSAIQPLLQVDTSTNPEGTQFLAQNLIQSSVDRRFEITAQNGGNNEVDGGDLPNDITQIFEIGSNFTKNWETNNCNPANMTIVDIAPGVVEFPLSMPENTIYRLQAGDYIISNIYQISVKNCDAIIGVKDLTKIYTQSTRNHTFNFNGNNIIVYGLIIDGEKNGIGGMHNKGAHGLLISSSASYPTHNNTISNMVIKNFGNGITVSNSSYNFFNKVNVLNSDNSGFHLYKMTYSKLQHINAYNNLKEGINFYRYNTDNVIENANIFNNNYPGLHISYESKNNTITNVNIFNNNYSGLRIDSSSSTNLFNNVSVFNNTTYGVDIYAVNSLKFHNLLTYNNSTYGLRSTGSSNYYFGTFKNFSNSSGNFYWTNGNDSKFNDGTSSYLGWSNGLLDSSDIFDSTFTIQPSVSGWDYTIVGQQALSFDGSESYTFGSNIANQTQPVKWNGSDFEFYGVEGEDYDSSKKVGQW